jgi:hypothetical protein
LKVSKISFRNAKLTAEASFLPLIINIIFTFFIGLTFKGKEAFNNFYRGEFKAIFGSIK